MSSPQEPRESIKSIRDMDLMAKSIFMRLDFNVPLSDVKGDEPRSITDDTRIKEALPTIKYAIEKGAKLVLASHLGRPDGKAKPEFSLEPVALHLAGLLGIDVTLADDCIGEGIELLVKGMKGGQVLLLENLRFHPGEEANDSEFAHDLARLADIYITDAFGTAHRKHASTYGVPALMSNRGMGFLIEKELSALNSLIHEPKEPFYALLGGSKVSDKIKTVEALMTHVNGLLIGGAMAHAFWAVQGDEIPAGAKQPKPEDIEAARKIIAEAKKREIPLLVPKDTNQGFDIGPKTIDAFADFLKDAKTIFWNGPLGWFEKPEYAHGTFEIAGVIASLRAEKIVGGGDTVSAVKQSGYAERFTHLSTGGGAVLEFIENGSLPGIDILKTSNRYKPEVMSRERIKTD